MPMLPASGSSTPRRDIAGAIMERISSIAAFPGLALFPMFTQDQRTGQFLRVKFASMDTLPDSVDAKGGAPLKRLHAAFETVSYECAEKGLELGVPWSNQADWAALFDQKSVAIMKVVKDMLRRHSADVLAYLINNTNFPLTGNTGLSVSVPWSTSASAVPLTDVNAGKEAIQKRCGRIPNTLLITHKTALNLSENAQLRQNIGLRYAPDVQEQGPLDARALGRALGVARVLVLEDAYNSAPENATAVYSRLLNDADGFLAYVSPEYEPGSDITLGRTIFNTNLVDPFVVDEYPEEKERQDVVRVQADWVIKAFVPECGFRLGNLAA